MLFPAICDVIRNLSGIWQMMFPDKYAKYIDVPQDFSASLGGTWWRSELDGIRHDFEKLPAHVRDGLAVHFARHFKDVAAVVFPGKK